MQGAWELSTSLSGWLQRQAVTPVLPDVMGWEKSRSKDLVCRIVVVRL